MKIKNIHSAYFIGIGGIGMSALARWFHHNGVQVYGYDKTSTELTTKLENEGISIHFDDEIEDMPAFVFDNDKGVLIVYTPAIPKEHKGFNYLKEKEIKMYKRSEVLGKLTEGMFTVAVAGTHGKTTTSSMVAHLLKSGKKDIAGFLGGITTNYGTNMVMNQCDYKKAIIVVEADEFDRSFLTLKPNIAVVTSTDADHLDIYGKLEELKKSFSLFLENVNPAGQIYIKDGLWDEIYSKKIKAEPYSYGLNAGDIRALNVQVKDAQFVFDVSLNNKVINGFQLSVPGFHNVENAVVAIAIANQLGVSEKEIIEGIKTYKGVKRRFEYVIQRDGFVFIDDYAHHPSEIKAMLTSVRALYPGKKVSVLFQPHLYSRTRDFAVEFSQSLSLADEVMLLDIYPARELPIEGVSSDILLESIQVDEKYKVEKESIVEYLSNRDFEIFITMGAGDIDRLVEPLKKMFNKQNAA
ncbi:UDP-N-acetylmuramate--L-alanine ligase [Marivirga harenae]|uniref:UDP-N-acetylmuramate--L-alanine ligase n=1 Tax=Marivirga harenae TaxID=2010992 RepID=UPI0026E0C721|nr:UDP-N-acetylmuramate--L-alanine ligase [Marivirga harenae]WKV14058.1 UDP-N-acetylmuramate--L-alanine ligase [Marivirga harenae]|tara:strand:+ start:371760 stop:373157 length:1398 start_codon:yes stop_codon:yes gene_type:complete